VLIQLPPDLPAAFDRLDATLAAFGPGVRVAVEPRHPSWFTDELRALLEPRDAALCIADRRRPITPLWQTASWLYVRLHEGRGSPRSCYGRQALASWARRLVELAGPDPAGYVYFNNDARACAIRNAVVFERALRRATPGPTGSAAGPAVRRL
jgi:uncharacterized protein YecE (DUF72 family)